MRDAPIPGFRKVPHTGVIYVMQKALEKGFKTSDKTWANLGQGAPEIRHIQGSPERKSTIHINFESHEYSPVAGTRELRQKVANLYNHFYRKGKESQYSWENVSISGGGRIALTRIAASLGTINLGHILPDYTAYEELLSIFKSFVPIPILIDAQTNYQISPQKINEEIIGRGLQAILMSNPCNPTGQIIKGEVLQQWVQIARERQCTLILDEFYSHYVYSSPVSDKLSPPIVSAAEYVEDVNRDPIVIVDGITKNWRYPGWRVSWTLAPREVINNIISSGSFLDGGASHPLQQEILTILEPEYVIQQADALQTCFKKKRQYVLDRLHSMNIIVETEPQGTFYIWAKLSDLPNPLKDGCRFFEAALDEKVITVPGVFFDINPEKRRTNARFQQYIRISFGPQMSELQTGLDSLERLIKKYQC